MQFSWPALLLSIGWLLGCGGPDGRRPSEPSVVLISVDTLRADHMGIYGYPRNTTPNLDRFFASGTVFSNAASTAPCTIPSIRQFLYGAFDVQADRKPLAEILGEHGYETGAVVSQQQLHKDDVSRYARGFGTFDIQGTDEVDHHGMSTRRADQVSDRAVAWLEEHAKDGRFFLWLHYFDPHDPFEPPAPFRDFDRGSTSRWSGDIRSHIRDGKRENPGRTRIGELIFDEQDAAHFNALYDGEVRFTDAEIGRVLAALPDRGESEIVILIADHGEWLGEEEQWGHCKTLGEEVIRVPFLMRVAGGALGGSISPDLPVTTLDVLPTILELLGIELPAPAYHGEALRNVPEERAVLAFWRRMSMIRSGRFKQLFLGTDATALYDIAEDPREDRNLIGEDRQVSDRLSLQMSGFRDLAEGLEAEDRRVVERLKQIGYID